MCLLSAWTLLNLPVVVWKVRGADDCSGALAQSTCPSANSWRFYINMTFNLIQQHVGSETSKAWLFGPDDHFYRLLETRTLYATKLSYFHSCMETIVGGRCACVESEKQKTHMYNFTY